MVEDDMSAARGVDGNLGYLFRLGHQTFREQLTEVLEPYGLSPAQYGVLSAFRRGRRLSSADLARLMAVTPQSMNAIVRTLVDAGLVEQTPSPEHGRVLLLGLTSEGRTVLRSSTRGVRRVEAQAVSGLSEREQRVVQKWLSGLASRQR